MRYVNNCKRGAEKKNWHLNSNDLTAIKRIWIQSIQGNVLSDVTFNKNGEFWGVHRHEDWYLRCIGRLRWGKKSFDTS